MVDRAAHFPGVPSELCVQLTSAYPRYSLPNIQIIWVKPKFRTTVYKIQGVPVPCPLLVYQKLGGIYKFINGKPFLFVMFCKTVCNLNYTFTVLSMVTRFEIVYRTLCISLCFSILRLIFNNLIFELFPFVNS